jgi:hypothetical protein
VDVAEPVQQAAWPSRLVPREAKRRAQLGLDLQPQVRLGALVPGHGLPAGNAH